VLFATYGMHGFIDFLPVKFKSQNREHNKFTSMVIHMLFKSLKIQTKFLSKSFNLNLFRKIQFTHSYVKAASIHPQDEMTILLKRCR
jgi:hypothetical protein